MPESSNMVLALKRRSSAVKACKVREAIEFNRRTAREWNKVEYCSAVCRRNRQNAVRVSAAS
jgi:hypothetical protein